MKHRRLSGLAAVVLAVTLLTALAGVAFATLKITDVLKAWDDKTNKYENGNLTLKFLSPGAPVDLEPFWVELNFDKGDYSVAGCGTTNLTEYAGTGVIGLYHTDVNGALGFTSSEDWGLVDCSKFGTVKYPDAYLPNGACVPADPAAINACEISSVDKVTPCTSGNCTDEIVTSFEIVVDRDCDGTIDPEYAPAGGLCMYWAAPKPLMGTPAWTGNIQARINGGGGDKTINFNPVGPNAVSLRGFAAVDARPLGAALVAGILGLAGLIFAWRSARG